MSPADEVILALDIGGTWTRAAAISAHGEVLGSVKERTRSHLAGASIIEASAGLLTRVAAQVDRSVRGVGVSTTGPVDPMTGVLFRPPNTGPGLEGLRLGDGLSDALGLPVVVDRDTNAAALAEQRYGAGRGTTNLVYVTVSTGVGGSVILDDRLLRGASGVAGELGHISVSPDGPVCGCGRTGCLEAIAAGPALAAAAAQALDSGLPSQLRQHDNRPLTGEQVAAAAAAGDQLARTVLLAARAAVASAAVDLVNVFNPERLVLGGSVILGNLDWVTEAHRAVSEQALEPARSGAEVVVAGLGDEGGLLGAALLFDMHEQARLAD
jgi:glucokinase